MDAGIPGSSHLPIGQTAPRVCVIGAAPDTGHLGMTAACWSILAALRARVPGVQVTVLDHGRGARVAHLDDAGGVGRMTYLRCGAGRTEKRLAPESLWRIRVSAWAGGLGNPAAMAIRGAGLVLDAGGAESLSDAHGPERFCAMLALKRIALECGRPLVLLPQSFGPFRSARARKAAARIVRGAALAWARDRRSFGVLQDLLGGEFDASRHACAPDLGFALDACAPKTPARGMQCWKARLKAGDDAAPDTRGRIALNVSAQLWNSADRAGVANYREVLHGFVHRVLEETDAGVLLVPFVLGSTGSPENDADACEDLAGAVPSNLRRRVAALEGVTDPRHLKWVLSLADWFCAARIPTAASALSAGVPGAGLAVSRKTRGVFDAVGLASHVIDLRKAGVPAAVESLWRSWTACEQSRAALSTALPGAARILDGVFDRVAELVGVPAPIAAAA